LTISNNLSAGPIPFCEILCIGWAHMAGPPTCAGSPHSLYWVMPWQQGITLHLILAQLVF